MWRFLVLLTMLVTTTVAAAWSSYQVERTCPIGGEKFTTEIGILGDDMGQHLDGSDIGRTASPRPLPKCPGNGFVLFREYRGEPLSNEEIAKLTPYVNSVEYQALQKDNTTYYLKAKLQEQLGDDYELVDAYLMATWQADETQYPVYAG